MSKRTLVIILVISVSINLAAILTFGYHWWEVRNFRREMPPRWIDRGPNLRRGLLKHRLDLTEEQIDAINARREEMRPKMRSLRKKMLTKREELSRLMRETEPNREKADSLIREIASLRAEVETRVFESLCQMRNILTPEQQKQFIRLYERRLRPEGMPPPPPEEPPGQGMQGRGRPERGERGIR